MSKYQTLYVTANYEEIEHYIYKIKLSKNQIILTSKLPYFHDFHTTVHEPDMIQGFLKRNIHTRIIRDKTTFDLTNILVDPNSEIDLITHQYGTFNLDQVKKLSKFMTSSYKDKINIQLCKENNINNIYFFVGKQSSMTKNMEIMGKRLNVPHERWIFEPGDEFDRTIGIITIRHPQNIIYPLSDSDEELEYKLTQRNFDFTKSFYKINSDGTIGEKITLIPVSQIERLQKRKIANMTA